MIIKLIIRFANLSSRADNSAVLVSAEPKRDLPDWFRELAENHVWFSPVRSAAGWQLHVTGLDGKRTTVFLVGKTVEEETFDMEGFDGTSFFPVCLFIKMEGEITK